jgi:hypothetical protein
MGEASLGQEGNAPPPPHFRKLFKDISNIYAIFLSTTKKFKHDW